MKPTNVSPADRRGNPGPVDHAAAAHAYDDAKKREIKSIRITTAKVVQWVSFALLIVCLATAIYFVGFLSGGTMAVRRDNMPLNYLFRLTGVISVVYDSNLEVGPFGFNWNPPITPVDSEGPVTRYDPTRSYPGVNLLLSSSTSASLVSMDGTELHRWSRDFDDVWPHPDHVAGYESGITIYWRRAHLFPNGDILVIYESPKLTPYGLGLAKLDKDSNVLWKVSANIHHDISVAPDGRIFALFQEISNKQYIDRVGFKTPYLSEGVMIIDKDGNVMKKVHILDALFHSDYFPLFETMFLDSLQGDFTHMNTVQFIDDSLAEKFPFAKAGQVLVSMREMNTIAILDLDEERVVWSMTGLFQRQHEAQLLNNGHILVFDNFGNTDPEEGATRILEFDPVTQKIAWSYEGRPDDPLESLFLGSQERLPNGNTLIVEALNGRALEVTPDKDVVWQYRLNETQTYDGVEYIHALTDMVRYESRDLDFLPARMRSGGNSPAGSAVTTGD